MQFFYVWANESRLPAEGIEHVSEWSWNKWTAISAQQVHHLILLSSWVWTAFIQFTNLHKPYAGNVWLTQLSHATYSCHKVLLKHFCPHSTSLIASSTPAQCMLSTHLHPVYISCNVCGYISILIGNYVPWRQPHSLTLLFMQTLCKCASNMQELAACVSVHHHAVKWRKGCLNMATDGKDCGL